METAMGMAERLAVGALAGLSAAGFFIGFFGWSSGLSRRESFLAGGTWVLICGLACLWPHAAPLQIVSALALLGLAALYLLRRGTLHPLWMGTLLCVWLLAGFLDGMVYEQRWQEQVMKAAGYLVLGGIFVFQQIFCIRQEIRKRALEEPNEAENRKYASESWRKAAHREYERLRIFEHDFRHHLDMLGALYEQGDPVQARAYLEDLKQARLSGRGRINGGERELSCIMLAKQEACRKARIQFSSQILGSPRGIAQMDMTALLLNLLDNAIRACEKAPEPRSIGIMLLARGELWQIELVNTGLYEPGVYAPGPRDSGEAEETADGLEQGDTGREDAGPAHGIGLVSVRQIVEKYRGVFEIRQEGSQVIQKVILTGQYPE